MCYLLRREDDYKLCYSEPKNPYVITSNGSYFCAHEYQKMVNDEKEIECHLSMDSDNVPIYGWADVDQNNLGITVSVDVAEYLLQGKSLDFDEYIEFEAALTPIPQ